MEGPWLITLFVTLAVVFAVATWAALQRAIRAYRANPWKPKPWEDDD